MKGVSDGLSFSRDPSVVCVHAMDSRACVPFVLLFIVNGAALIRNGESRKWVIVSHFT